jgi:hypothetical protein
MRQFSARIIALTNFNVFFPKMGTSATVSGKATEMMVRLKTEKPLLPESGEEQINYRVTTHSLNRNPQMYHNQLKKSLFCQT